MCITKFVLFWFYRTIRRSVPKSAIGLQAAVRWRRWARGFHSQQTNKIKQKGEFTSMRETLGGQRDKGLEGGQRRWRRLKRWEVRWRMRGLTGSICVISIVSQTMGATPPPPKRADESVECIHTRNKPRRWPAACFRCALGGRYWSVDNREPGTERAQDQDLHPSVFVEPVLGVRPYLRHFGFVFL